MDKISILKNSIQKLPPAYFALVMATGILSLAAHLQHFERVSSVLFWLNNSFFFILLLLYALRLFLFFPNFINDLSAHAKGAGFLTLVAGSCILGTQYIQLKQNDTMATVLWVFSIVLWMVLIYAFLIKVILKKEKPSPEQGLSGIWLLMVVATQALSVLACTLAPHSSSSALMLFFSLFTYLLGIMLYLILIPIITNRLLFYPVTPEEVPPSYWINMGAAAITTLAGIVLSQNIRTNVLFSDFYFFTKATALLLWAIGTFWIPVVLILEVWRYGIQKSPLKYEPGFWSMVFPLGMYTVCTWRLTELLPFSFLQTLAKVFFYIAGVAWLVTLFGLCKHLVQLIGRPGEQQKATQTISA